MKDAAQQPYLYVYLDISGTFDPVVFSQTVGLVADEMRRRGERLFPHLNTPARIRGCDDWKIKITGRYTFLASDLLDELLERLQGHEAIIRSTAQALDLQIVVQVVAEWNANITSTPVFGLTTIQMERLVALGAFYDVDFHPLVTHEAGSYTGP